MFVCCVHFGRLPTIESAWVMKTTIEGVSTAGDERVLFQRIGRYQDFGIAPPGWTKGMR